MNSAKITVPEVRPLVAAYYALPGNLAGGNLHIVLDDGNVDTDSVRHCLNRCIAAGDTAGQTVAELLLRMTRTQRLKLYRNKGLNNVDCTSRLR